MANQLARAKRRLPAHLAKIPPMASLLEVSLGILQISPTLDILGKCIPPASLCCPSSGQAQETTTTADPTTPCVSSLAQKAQAGTRSPCHFALSEAKCRTKGRPAGLLQVKCRSKKDHTWPKTGKGLPSASRWQLNARKDKPRRNPSSVAVRVGVARRLRVCTARSLSRSPLPPPSPKACR